MPETKEQEAKREISEAYQKACESGSINPASPEGRNFGRVCVKWHDWYVTEKPKDKGDRIRFMWRALGIPHTAAYLWMSVWRAESGVKPPIVQYTQEELEHSAAKAENENRLEVLFAGCGFPYQVKQNCATNELHFDVSFKALPESEVRRLAGVFPHE